MSQFSYWISENKGKFISLVVSALYLFGAYTFLEWDFGDLLKLAAFLIFPLACIWFGDAMGGWTGFSRPLGPRISQESPGCLVAFIGWILLFLPLLIGIIVILSN